MSFTSSNPFSCFPKLFRPISHKSLFRKDPKAGRKKKRGSSDSNVEGGTFFLFMRLRKKIFIFRDIFDIPPISSSQSILEVVTDTIDELNRMYPDLMPGYPILKMKEKSTHQGLICLYHVLECMADSWVEDKSTRDKLKKPHIETSPLDKLVEVVLEMLECINKAAKDRFELMDVERRYKQSGSFKLKPHSKRSVECNSEYSSRSPSSLSPRTPNSVLPDSPRFADLLGAMLRSYSCHQLLNLRVQAVEELSPMDLKRLVVHVMPHFTANNNNNLHQNLKPASMEEEAKTETKDNTNNNIEEKEVSTRPSAPPPPPPPSSAAPPPPVPPPVKGKKRNPPPPPSCSMRTVVCPRNKTKLKRSSHMGNLYRNLRGKVEGSCLPGRRSSPGNKNVNAGNGGSVAGGGGSGMADALAEMTKRSSYFQNIEEDMEKHGKEIKELQCNLSVFKTSDMDELLRFHNRVESLLEVLTDETQILSKFEGFPMHKLETLRAAAALSRKLNTIVSEIKNWKIEPPLSENLDRVEKYFNKVKAKLEGLERTKDEQSKLFESEKIQFDLSIFTKIKELMVDLSSGFIELALKERREDKAEMNDNVSKTEVSSVKMLWKAFQFAFKVYSFAGGQDERADSLTTELAKEIETHPIED